jgi:hypothetical protein
MGLITGCVTHALHKVWVKITLLTKLIFKAYYRLTAYVPRPRPRTLEEFMTVKQILIDHFGLPDRPDVWFTVASQITVGEPTSLRRAYIYYANAAKRLPTNRLVREAKAYFDKLNEDLIKELTENIVASPQPKPLQPNE